ncbi:MAG TPA: DUF3604 domain-containing protein [Firmicutes bacterium]|nr:DUF3604 domain-containing protein [Bacillota bacterium]
MNKFFITIKTALFVSASVSLLILLGCGGGSVNTNPSGQKNPLDEYKTLSILYGDPHVHTNLSDGDESPDFAIRYARDTIGLDWVSITDHVEYLAKSSPAIIEYYRSLPQKFDNPGKFCVLYGYEWTSISYGHRNVYTLDSNIPLLSCEDPRWNTIEKFWDALKGHDVITVPHHTIMHSNHSWTKKRNPGVEVAIEFYSKWGNSLSTSELRQLPNPYPPNSVLSGLVKEGLRYGLIAGTDTHMSRPASVLRESRQKDAIEYAQPGITGVWATSHTREGIYNGIKNRHTYGMTGTKLMLMFSVNNRIMGNEISSNSAPVITFRVESPVVISRIAILKISDGKINEIKEFHPNALILEGDFTDTQFTGDSAYLLRVELVNTDMALCSPVWVKYIS